MKKLILIWLLALIPTLVYSQGRTPTGSLVTTSGSEPAGDKTVTFIFSSDFSGTLCGVTFIGSADKAFTMPPLPPGDSWGPIPYTVTAGSIRIMRGK